MINIIQKEDCCGCEACYQVCPVNCISKETDSEGFYYPIVDMTSCINCNLCEKVCPIIQQTKLRKPLYVYASKNKDEIIRRNSSSGGIFTLLAEKIIDEGGVVFGVKYNDDWKAIHAYTETKVGISEFRGSKYIESIIGDSFILVKRFLKQGRKVLFSGTPCQIRGLNLFLRNKKYDKLLTIDFVCHGVPSPGIFSEYLNQVIKNNSIDNITSISFRDKKTGWKKFSLTIESKERVISNTLEEDIFMRGFLSDLYLRPACHKCPSKNFKSGSDITLADYWGVHKVLSEFDDDKGVSLIFINSEMGKNIYESIDTISIATSYSNAVKYNPSVEKSSAIPPNRSIFFEEYSKDHALLLPLILKYTRLSIKKRIKRKITYLIKKIIKQ